jgi:hypothetical protein
MKLKSIKYVGKKEQKCIYLSGKSHLYYTDDDVITHNTILAGTASEIGFWSAAGYAVYINTPILMADGTTKALADVSVGDALAHPDGKENVVLDIPFDGVDDEYEVAFDDGRTARCNLDHLWKVTHDGVEEVVDTKYLLEHPGVSFEVPSI